MSVFLNNAEALKTYIILTLFGIYVLHHSYLNIYMYSGAIVNSDWPCRLFYYTTLLPSRIAHIMIKELLTLF